MEIPSTSHRVYIFKIFHLLIIDVYLNTNKQELHTLRLYSLTLLRIFLNIFLNNLAVEAKSFREKRSLCHLLVSGFLCGRVHGENRFVCLYLTKSRSDLCTSRPSRIVNVKKKNSTSELFLCESSEPTLKAKSLVDCIT